MPTVRYKLFIKFIGFYESKAIIFIMQEVFRVSYLKIILSGTSGIIKGISGVTKWWPDGLFQKELILRYYLRR